MSRTYAHAFEFSQGSRNLIGRKLILSNFSSEDGNFLFTYARWSSNSMVSSIGFFISNSQYVISLEGCLAFPMDDNINADMAAIGVAIQATMDF